MQPQDQSVYIPPHLRGGGQVFNPQAFNGVQVYHRNDANQMRHQHMMPQHYQPNMQNQMVVSGGFSNCGGSTFGQRGRGGYQGSRHNNSGGFQPQARWNQAQDEEEVLKLFETTGVSKGINFSQYDNIPVSIHPEGSVKPIHKFTDVSLPPELMENISRCGYEIPTPVQKHTIPISLNNLDVMACAQTGSGKTAAFLIPVLAKILSIPREGSPTYGVAYTQCVVMAPTRELAIQIHIEARKFCYRTRLRTTVLYGGADIRGQMQILSHGGDIVIATPGRLWDMYQRGRVRFRNLRCLVLDEADRMLDMGFEPQIRQIIQSRDTDMPLRDARQTLMFSATFPREIQKLAHEFLSRNFIHLTVGRIGSTTQNIVQVVWQVEDFQKMNALLQVLTNQTTRVLTVVFAETRRGVEEITRCLVREGFQAVSIHGDKVQSEREIALSLFKTGKKPILVATDVASRGLDIPNVMCIIQFDLPHHIDEYVHRIGRTGRCGNEGEAVAFFAPKNLPMAKDLIDIITEANQDVPAFLFEAVTAAAFQQQQKQWERKTSRGRGNQGFGRGGGYQARQHQPHFDNGQQGGGQYFRNVGDANTPAFTPQNGGAGYHY